MRRSLLIPLLALVLAVPAHAASEPPPGWSLRQKIHYWVHDLRVSDAALGVRAPRYGGFPKSAPWPIPYATWVKDLWKHRALVARRQVALLRAQVPSGALLQDFLCIHHYEGAWNDPGAPYWGGLQMDVPFMEGYGPEFWRAYGTADHWPPRDQLIAAKRAWQVRGFSPWPNTARDCGLLP